MSVTMELEGDAALTAIFKDMQLEGYQKPVKAAFKKAAVPVKREMGQALPPQLSGIKKVLKVQAGKGKSMAVSVGFFGNAGMYVNSRGKQWNPYMLLYWFNYGTLANRDPGHKFLKARRRISAYKKGGIKPAHIVEGAWTRVKDTAAKTFEKAWQEEYEKFLKKRAEK